MTPLGLTDDQLDLLTEGYRRTTSSDPMRLQYTISALEELIALRAALRRIVERDWPPVIITVGGTEIIASALDAPDFLVAQQIASDALEGDVLGQKQEGE